MDRQDAYSVHPPRVPPRDVSGPLSRRVLALLSIQSEHNLRILERERDAGGRIGVADARYTGHWLGANAYALAALARFGEPGTTMGGTSRDVVAAVCVDAIRALVRTHPVGGGETAWSTFVAARFLHVLGMGAWLAWDWLDAETRLLVARILAHEADRFLGAAVPAQLHDDTQAESNAWTGGGIAVAACMLASHPHRERWDLKAKEYMVSAYATALDCRSDRVVDGRPLSEWLTGPNAFADYTVENHGFVHPDYMAAVSEMVRSAIAYRLAGEPVPEAATFNADHVFDMLVRLSLPDGTHLYVQGTEYTPRRVDSLWQACGIVPLRPTPLRRAVFARTLAVLEDRAQRRPDLPMGGWLGFPYDLGSTWGLTQNYLICRLFGCGDGAPDGVHIEEALAGVHVCEEGRFALHRTARTVTSFSWHPAGRDTRVMAVTMPLCGDVLCYPMPLSAMGDVRVAGDDGPGDVCIVRHRVVPREDGFGAVVELRRCSGSVVQYSAVVSLPDGRSVYLEQRTARADVVLDCVTSGTVVLFDDLRWPSQASRRIIASESGRRPCDRESVARSTWVNVDDRLGWVTLGCSTLRVAPVPGKPGIWRGTDTMYDTCGLGFEESGIGREFRTGDMINVFGMVTCPEQTSAETAASAAATAARGWRHSDRGVLALEVAPCVVHANFTDRPQRFVVGGEQVVLAPFTAGWV